MTTAQTPTLTVLYEGSPIFTSHGKWLHPLFELEEYLAEHPIQSENLILQDKIIGKAAALLIHRLGFRTVKAGVLSRLGEAVLQRHGIAYTYEQLVDHIHCQTGGAAGHGGGPRRGLSARESQSWTINPCGGFPGLAGVFFPVPQHFSPPKGGLFLSRRGGFETRQTRKTGGFIPIYPARMSASVPTGYAPNSLSRTVASWRSAVSKPSVNQS
jgi:Domain of unknown function (DUF1893)